LPRTPEDPPHDDRGDGLDHEPTVGRRRRRARRGDAAHEDTDPTGGTSSTSVVGRVVAAARSLPRPRPGEQLNLAGHLLRWVGLGAVVGVLAGVSAWALLNALTWATEVRVANPWLLFLLPAAGFVVGFAYYRWAGTAIAGNNLLLDEIHDPRSWVPRRMAPLIYAATVVTQVFGGSAGREGTALQMAGSLTDWFSRTIRLPPQDRRILLIAALAGGFGAVFGVPLAGAVFGLEVQSIGRLRYDALVPALAASVVGNQVTLALGIHHEVNPQLSIEVEPLLLLKVAVAGLAFAAAGALFIELTHAVKVLVGAAIPWPPGRPILGGLVIIGLVLVVGNQDYLGLSLPLISHAIEGQSVGFEVFLLKIVFTAVTLGTGFQGGEVTPLFVIGATLGAALGTVLGVPVEIMAAIGYVAVFAGAANTPLACTIMGVELFGSHLVVPIAVACVVSFVFSSHRSIYSRQRVTVRKDGTDHDVIDGIVGGVHLAPPRWARRRRADPGSGAADA
jgi:H+/Cl- antiporter ClcA